MTNSTLLERLYTIKNGDLDIDCLISEVKAEITKEEAKKCGRNSAFKACERIIKRGKNIREAMSGAWIDEKGRECICDGVIAARLITPLNLEKIPEGVEPINLNRVMDAPKGDILQLPSIKELKVFIKIKKAEQKADKQKGLIAFDFGENLPAVDAEYLLNILETLPNAVAMTSARRPLISAIHFDSEHGDGILMPIRKY